MLHIQQGLYGWIACSVSAKSKQSPVEGIVRSWEKPNPELLSKENHLITTNISLGFEQELNIYYRRYTALGGICYSSLTNAFSKMKKEK